MNKMSNAKAQNSNFKSSSNFKGQMTKIITFEHLYTATLIIAKAVIPAPYQVRDKLQQESRKTLDSGSSPE